MSTIEQNLQKLVDAKESIRTAIQNKKVAVPESASISTYSTYIDQIEFKGLQTKTYNITENGRTIISPDEGFDGISGGVIEVNVPSSGDYNGTVNVNIFPANLPAVVTITYADKTETKTNETGMVTFKTYSGVDYKLSFSDVEGYYTPFEISGHVNYNETRMELGKYLDDSEAYFEYTVTGTTTYVTLYNSNKNGFITSYSIDGNTPVSVTASSSAKSVFLSHGVHRVKYTFNTTKSPDISQFADIKQLTSVTIPPEWNEISLEMFKNAVFETITIPPTITIIKDFAFQSCPNLKTAIVGCTGDISARYLFVDCTSLTEVTIEQTAKIINSSYMFRGCKALTDVNINTDKFTLSPFTFYECNSLNNINGAISDIGEDVDYAFYYCSALTSVDLGNAVVSTQPIDALGMFSGCRALTSVIMPNTTYIPLKSTFYNCTSLQTIVMKSTTAPEIDTTSSPFTWMSQTGTLYYPSGSDYSTWLAAMPSGWTGVPV